MHPMDFQGVDDAWSASPWAFIAYILFNVGLWMMLRKAGMPAFGAIIPIYNVYLYIKLGGLSGFTIVLLVVPIVNLFAWLYISGRVAQAFGHGALMAIFGLFLIAPIGFLVLGFDRSRYALPRFGAAVSNNGA